MVNSKVINKQTKNLEYSYKWLQRAKNDLKMFKQLVPCNKYTRKIAYCKDPALCVYLLQQSIEKATKAVAAATGKYPYSKLKSHGHNSLAVLLEFYKRTFIGQDISAPATYSNTLHNTDICAIALHLTISHKVKFQEIAKLSPPPRGEVKSRNSFV